MRVKEKVAACLASGGEDVHCGNLEKEKSILCKIVVTTCMSEEDLKDKHT